MDSYVTRIGDVTIERVVSSAADEEHAEEQPDTEHIQQEDNEKPQPEPQHEPEPEPEPSKCAPEEMGEPAASAEPEPKQSKTEEDIDELDDEDDDIADDEDEEEEDEEEEEEEEVTTAAAAPVSLMESEELLRDIKSEPVEAADIDEQDIIMHEQEDDDEEDNPIPGDEIQPLLQVAGDIEQSKEEEEEEEEVPVEEPIVKQEPIDQEDEEQEEEQDEEEEEESFKRKAGESDDETEKSNKKKKSGEEGEVESDKTMSGKATNLRKNIREVMDETQLDEATLSAQRQEMERLKRVQDQQKYIREVQRQIAINRQNNKTQTRVISLLQGNATAKSSTPGSSKPSTVLVKLSSNGGPPQVINKKVLEVLKGGKTSTGSMEQVKPGICRIPNKPHMVTPSVSIAPVKPTTPTEPPKAKDVVTISSSSDEDDCIVISEPSDEEMDEEEDPNNSGMHTNDLYNIPDEQGRVLINVGKPENDPDIFLAPQIARIIKPHQIGGVRFMFDNVVESLERFGTSPGFGCILAHSMGLGKTLQVVSFCDVFLRETSACTVMCIMPINTLQNWLAEFNMWLPTDPASSPLSLNGEVRPRHFGLFVLNDLHKTISARSRVVQEWKKDGGVLLIGYEMYRQLSLRRPARTRKGKKKMPDEDMDDEKNKPLLDDMHEALVKPGPDLVICDEGHRIKNSHASISHALKQIRTRRRIVLTGYPLQNNLQEYWCMVDFVRPNYLGTKTEFSNMFERPIQNGQCIDSTPKDIRLMRYRAHVLHSLLEGFVQRRSHAVLRNTLPQKEEYVILVRMTTFQRKLYDTFMNEVVRTKAVPNPLKAFAVCCKIWNHPDILYNFLKKREMDELQDLDLEEAAALAPRTNSVQDTSSRKVRERKGKGNTKKAQAIATPIKNPAVATVPPNTSQAMDTKQEPGSSQESQAQFSQNFNQNYPYQQYNSNYGQNYNNQSSEFGNSYNQNYGANYYNQYPGYYQDGNSYNWNQQQYNYGNYYPGFGGESGFFNQEGGSEYKPPKTENGEFSGNLNQKYPNQQSWSSQGQQASYGTGNTGNFQNKQSKINVQENLPEQKYSSQPNFPGHQKPKENFQQHQELYPSQTQQQQHTAQNQSGSPPGGNKIPPGNYQTDTKQGSYMQPPTPSGHDFQQQQMPKQEGQQQQQAFSGHFQSGGYNSHQQTNFPPANQAYPGPSVQHPPDQERSNNHQYNKDTSPKHPEMKDNRKSPAKFGEMQIPPPPPPPPPPPQQQQQQQHHESNPMQYSHDSGGVNKNNAPGFQSHGFQGMNYNYQQQSNKQNQTFNSQQGCPPGGSQFNKMGTASEMSGDRNDRQPGDNSRAGNNQQLNPGNYYTNQNTDQSSQPNKFGNQNCRDFPSGVVADNKQFGSSSQMPQSGQFGNQNITSNQYGNQQSMNNQFGGASSSGQFDNCDQPQNKRSDLPQNNERTGMQNFNTYSNAGNSSSQQDIPPNQFSSQNVLGHTQYSNQQNTTGSQYSKSNMTPTQQACNQFGVQNDYNKDSQGSSQFPHQNAQKGQYSHSNMQHGSQFKDNSRSDFNPNENQFGSESRMNQTYMNQNMSTTNESVRGNYPYGNPATPSNTQFASQCSPSNKQSNQTNTQSSQFGGQSLSQNPQQNKVGNQSADKNAQNNYFGNQQIGPNQNVSLNQSSSNTFANQHFQLNQQSTAQYGNQNMPPNPQAGSHGSTQVGGHANSHMSAHSNPHIGTHTNSQIGGHSNAQVATPSNPQIGGQTNAQIGSHTNPQSTNSQIGSHTNPQMGAHSSSQVGGHSNPQMGSHQSSQLGSHSNTQIGNHASSQMGSHPNPQIGSHAQMGGHNSNQMGSHNNTHMGNHNNPQMASHNNGQMVNLSNTQMGNHTNSQGGNHAHSQIGSHTNLQSGNHPNTQMGSHTNPQMGCNSNPQMGSHANIQMGNHPNPQLASHGNSHMGSHTSPSMGSPLNSQMGSHTNHHMAGHTTQQMGSHSNPQMGNNSNHPIGSHTNSQMGNHQHQQVGNHSNPQMSNPQMGNHSNPQVGSHTSSQMVSHTSPPMGSSASAQIGNNSQMGNHANPQMGNHPITHHSTPPAGSPASSHMGAHHTSQMGSHGNPHMSSHTTPIGSPANSQIGNHSSPQMASHTNAQMGGHGNQQMGSHGNPQIGSHTNPQMGTHGNQQIGSHGNQQMGSHGGQQMGSHTNPLMGSHGNQQMGSHGNQQVGSHGNQQMGSHGNQQIGSHGNQQTERHANPQMGSHANQQMGSHTNSQMGNHGNQQMGNHTNPQMGAHGNQQVGSHSNPQMGSHSNQQMGSHINQQMGSHINQQMGSHTNAQVGSHSNSQMGSQTNPQMGTHGNQQMGSHSNSQMGSHGNQQMGNHGNQQMGSHGNQQMGSHGNQQMVSHGNQQMGSHGSQQMGSHTNQQMGSHGSQQMASHGNQQVSSHSNSHMGSHGNQQMGSHTVQIGSHQNSQNTSVSTGSHANSQMGSHSGNHNMQGAFGGQNLPVSQSSSMPTSNQSSTQTPTPPHYSMSGNQFGNQDASNRSQPPIHTNQYANQSAPQGHMKNSNEYTSQNMPTNQYNVQNNRYGSQNVPLSQQNQFSSQNQQQNISNSQFDGQNMAASSMREQKVPGTSIQRSNQSSGSQYGNHPSNTGHYNMPQGQNHSGMNFNQFVNTNMQQNQQSNQFPNPNLPTTQQPNQFGNQTPASGNNTGPAQSNPVGMSGNYNNQTVQHGTQHNHASTQNVQLNQQNANASGFHGYGGPNVPTSQHSTMTSTHIQQNQNANNPGAQFSCQNMMSNEHNPFTSQNDTSGNLMTNQNPSNNQFANQNPPGNQFANQNPSTNQFGKQQQQQPLQNQNQYNVYEGQNAMGSKFGTQPTPFGQFGKQDQQCQDPFENSQGTMNDSVQRDMMNKQGTSCQTDPIMQFGKESNTQEGANLEKKDDSQEKESQGCTAEGSKEPDSKTDADMKDDMKKTDLVTVQKNIKEDPGIPYDWATELLKGYVPGKIEASAKMSVFFCILEESIALGDRILVFSQSLFTLNLMEELLQQQLVPGKEEKWLRNVNYYRLDGSTSALEREKLINEFNSNPNLHLFLVSTRAGSLGINLVGANRVIVFDASWNPCHDTQAVCRVYRYGQKKPCFVYRLVTDNCLEKKIYDRQINKQGMADRVVDECNPEAHLSIKEVTSLCWDDQEDNTPKDFTDLQHKYIDVVIQKVLQKHSSLLSKEPFHHESLLVDRKDKKLSQAEKRLAKRSYELEKQANSNNARPLYNHYPNNIGTQAGVQMRGVRQDKPMASVRPMQSELGSQLVRDGRQQQRGWIPASVWQRQGMSAQEMTLPLDVVIPTNSPDRASIVLKAGQKVMVLKSPKGIYMQLENGKIIAIRTAFKVGQKDKKGVDKPEPKKDASTGLRPRHQIPNLRSNSSISIIPRSSMGPRTPNAPTKPVRLLGPKQDVKGKQPMAAARPYIREPPVTVTVTKKRIPEASTSEQAKPPMVPTATATKPRSMDNSDSSDIESFELPPQMGENSRGIAQPRFNPHHHHHEMMDVSLPRGDLHPPAASKSVDTMVSTDIDVAMAPSSELSIQRVTPSRTRMDDPSLQDVSPSSKSEVGTQMSCDIPPPPSSHIPQVEPLQVPTMMGQRSQESGKTPPSTDTYPPPPLGFPRSGDGTEAFEPYKKHDPSPSYLPPRSQSLSYEPYKKPETNKMDKSPRAEDSRRSPRRGSAGEVFQKAGKTPPTSLDKTAYETSKSEGLARPEPYTPAAASSLPNLGHAVTIFPVGKTSTQFPEYAGYPPPPPRPDYYPSYPTPYTGYKPELAPLQYSPMYPEGYNPTPPNPFSAAAAVSAPRAPPGFGEPEYSRYSAFHRPDTVQPPPPAYNPYTPYNPFLMTPPQYLPPNPPPPNPPQ